MGIDICFGFCNVWKKNDNSWEFRKVQNFEKPFQFVVIIFLVQQLFLFYNITLVITWYISIASRIIWEKDNENTLNSKFSILLITAKPVNPTTINHDVLFSKLANKERSFLSLFFQFINLFNMYLF